MVAGAGIGGLVAALSLHEIGMAVDVYESVRSVRPLGVGINLLPHAARELDALGLLPELRSRAVEPESLVYCSRHGRDIWREPRGRAAGYEWPQVSIHRGVLQELLLDAFVERVGSDHLHLGHRLERVDDTTATFDGARVVTGDLVVAADGIHRVARAQHYPTRVRPSGTVPCCGAASPRSNRCSTVARWSGPGTVTRSSSATRSPTCPTAAKRSTSSPSCGGPGSELGRHEDWNRPGELDDFLPEFEDWNFDWLDVPSIIRSAPGTFVFPMVDRDPVERWVFGRSTLLGDAAHPIYPIGSNGASQAILDARVLAGCLRSDDGVVAALERYEALRLPATAAIVRANRGLGPELPMQLVHERAPDGFDDVDDVITRAEIDEATEAYRSTAGFALAALRDDPRSLVDQVADVNRDR